MQCYLIYHFLSHEKLDFGISGFMPVIPNQSPTKEYGSLLPLSLFPVLDLVNQPIHAHDVQSYDEVSAYRAVAHVKCGVYDKHVPQLFFVNDERPDQCAKIFQMQA